MTSSNPLISVIIPVYNVEQYLRECLDSVRKQSFEHFEVILADDGSTDASADICREYCEADPRFRYYLKSNGGASSARNLGLDCAGGEWIFFLDSDDYLDPAALERLYRVAVKENADFVFSEAIAFDDTTGKSYDNKNTYHKYYPAGNPQRIMREMIYHREFHVAIWAMLISKRLFEAYGLRFVEGIMYEDMILSYQIYALSDKAAHLHEALYHRRYRENSVMTSKRTVKNFISAKSVYDTVSAFSAEILDERRNTAHVIRCAYNALSIYRSLSAAEKIVQREAFRQLKRDIAAHRAYGDTALRLCCRGYPFWAAYKAARKLFVSEKPDTSLYLCENKEKRKVMLLLPHMVGGGAERVAAQLLNCMDECGIDTRFFLTSDKRSEVVRSDLSEHIPLFLFKEEMPSESALSLFCRRLSEGLSSLLCKPFELLHRDVPADLAKLSLISQYGREIRFTRELLKADPDLTVIVFLQPTIPIVLLAAKDLKNRIIISERADPNRLMKKRYGRKFIEKYYPRADAAVFQTDDARAVYPKSVADKGVVIFNPVKPNLPAPYHGKRNHTITTFCRISKQKNLPLLIEAFAKIHKNYPDFTLRIIGDTVNAEGEEVYAILRRMISDNGIEDAVRFEPFDSDVHRSILKDAMYVNSSDFEGISNAMLEAMAIGMPVVCTDCPIGGARAMIKDGENGLLVPIRDAEALCQAMKLLVEDREVSQTLSQNASHLREELSVETIAKKWEELL